MRPLAPLAFMLQQDAASQPPPEGREGSAASGREGWLPLTTGFLMGRSMATEELREDCPSLDQRPGHLQVACVAKDTAKVISGMDCHEWLGQPSAPGQLCLRTEHSSHVCAFSSYM